MSVNDAAGDGATSDDRGIPPIQFAQARGARIAYQDHGSGPPIVVAVPPMAQNLELAWERPEIRYMLERFGSFCRWVSFDKRGTGASDRRSRVPGIDERVDDLRAVMDAAGVERSFLYGASEGGPMCLLFAATYPDRVEGLILHGSGAYTEDPDLDEAQLAQRREIHAQIAEVWGTPASPMVDYFAPSMAPDADYRAWHQRYERFAADAESLRELLDISLEVDVRSVLPQIDVPTLVLHRKGDLIIPMAFGREVADAIPGAEMVELEGNDHFAYAGDLDWLEDLERFVTGSVSPHRAPPRAARPQVRIRTLGRFAVEVEGEELSNSAWGSRLSRQLCKRLVAARGWPVTRDELFDMLWPDETDSRKLGPRLSVQLSAVRRVLDGAVVADRQTVALDLEKVSVDLEDVFHAADDDAVISAYDGEFLTEDLYEDWSAAARDEVRAMFVASAHRTGSAALADDDHLQASGLARRLIEIDRYDEVAHRLLVESLLGFGEVSEARRAHDNWWSAMADIDVEIDSFADVQRSTTTGPAAE